MNQNQGPPTFLYDIPSIHQKHPEIPATLALMDLNRQILAGDPLNYDQVTHAKAVARVLGALRDDGDPQITHEMVTTSASRAVAVECAYAFSEFLPQDISQVLQINNRLGNVEHLVQIFLAQTANLRLIKRNARLLEYSPLQKSVPGYGRDLALPLVAIMDANDQQIFHAEYPPGGNAALIGTSPPNFYPDVHDYSHLNICTLVAFYNENFDIIPADDLNTRIKKFCIFLSEM